MTLSMEKGIQEAIQVDELYVGVGWKATGGGKKGIIGKLRKMQGTDLDVWSIAFDAYPNAKALAWFDDRDPYEDASLIVSVDNTTGKAPGDDEFITAILNRLPVTIRTVVFGVSAFKEGVSFDNVSMVSYRVVDESSRTEIGKDTLPVDSSRNTAILCKVSRDAAGSPWSFSVIGALETARTRQEIIRVAGRHV